MNAELVEAAVGTQERAALCVEVAANVRHGAVKRDDVTDFVVVAQLAVGGERHNWRLLLCQAEPSFMKALIRDIIPYNFMQKSMKEIV